MKAVSLFGSWKVPNYTSTQFEISWVSRTDWVWSKHCSRILIKTNLCDPVLRIKGNGWKFHHKSVMPIGAINNLCFSYWRSGWPRFKWRFCYFMKALLSKILSTQVSIPRTEIDLLNTVVLKVKSEGCWRSDNQGKLFS